MSDFSIDPTTGDLEIVNGDLVLNDGKKALMQLVKQTLEMFYGEWFLDNGAGIPYYQYILVKDPNIVTVSAILQNAILAIPGIVELTAFDFDYDGKARQLNVTFTAESNYGIIEYEGHI